MDGVFESDGFGSARAPEVMSTQSETDFEWSVKLIGEGDLIVGIASIEFLPGALIFEYDQNAILYTNSREFLSCISIGSSDVHRNLPKRKSGDVIRFRFQPRRKKFVIYLVRI